MFGLRKRGVLTVLAAVLAVSYAMPAFAQEGPVCTVNGIMGTVKVFSARTRGANPDDVSTWADARLNMPLREKDMIATSAESEVRLETPDGSSVRLRERTTIEVAMLKGGADAMNARLKVNEGGIIASVKKMAGGKSSFEFETPTSLAAIRGTTIELDERKGTSTTFKTFDGTIEVTPSGASSSGKGKKKGKAQNSINVGNFEITQVFSGQQSASSREIPSFYRPKTTNLLNEEETAALTGFTRVMLTYSELEEVKRMLESDGIPCAIGIGLSDNERVARNTSADDARAQLAVAMSTQVQRISESYTQNIGTEAKTVWEESVRQLTDVSVRGSVVRTTITQSNPTTEGFRVYSLMVLEPERFKNAMMSTTNRLEEELELRVKKDDMMSKMDASIKAFNTRYHDR
jgi:hypothetical protein